MSKRWVQAENEKDEKLNVWVQIEDPDIQVGTATTLEYGSPILGPDGRPIAKRQEETRRPIGFGKP